MRIVTHRERDSFIDCWTPSFVNVNFTKFKSICIILQLNFSVSLYFLQNYLLIKTKIPKKKIRILKKPFFGKKTFQYDNIFGKVITRYQSNNLLDIFSKDFILSLLHKSYYLKNGSKDLIILLRKLIKKQKIKILFNHNINSFIHLLLP